MRTFKETRDEILEELKGKVNRYNEHELNVCFSSDEYLKDDKYIYLKASDGVMAMPYDAENDNETFVSYDVIHPNSCRFLGYGENEDLKEERISYLTSLIELLK